jgi:short-subunit dehydrogenase
VLNTFCSVAAVAEAQASAEAHASAPVLACTSQTAKHGYPNTGPYCAAKFGILGLSEALQHEVHEFGIHVHCLCPGLVQVPAPQNESEFRPGVLLVENLASVTLFLLKQPRRVQIENIGLYHF